MKKITLLLCFVFMLCGCTANYNLTINDYKVTEEFSILGQDNSSTKEYIETNLKYPTTAKASENNDYIYDDDKKLSYYEVSRIEQNGMIGLNYKYEFSFDNYYDSNVMNSCYEYFKVINSGSSFTISTSKENKCVSTGVDIINVNINTGYKVVEHNADSVEGHNYIWTITQTNNKDKNIYIKLDTKKKAEKTEEEKEKEQKILKIFTTVGIILLTFVGIGILLLVFRIKKVKND